MREWIRRLRSGTRTQRQGSLHVEVVGEHSYCSLGLAAEIVAETGIVSSAQLPMPIQVTDDNNMMTIVHQYAGSIATLHPRIRAYFGIDAPTMYRLIYLNDTANHSFCEIADFLEREFLSDDISANATRTKGIHDAESVGPRSA